MYDFPCKGCDQRSVGCHGTCEAYRKAKAGYAEALEQDKKKKQGMLQTWELRRESIERTKRRNHDRKERK